MNKDRKQRFYDVINSLEDASSELGDIMDEEQDAYDSLSEGLQCSSRGDKMLEYIDLMESVMSQIDDVISYITGSIIKKK